MPGRLIWLLSASIARSFVQIGAAGNGASLLGEKRVVHLFLRQRG
jgi:hypothetical protein